MQRHHRLSQRGFTLLEMTITLLVMGLLFIGIWQLIAYLNQQLQDQAVARHTRAIAIASLKYAKANGSTLPNNVWTRVDLSAMVPQFLPAGISGTNIVGHTYNVVMRHNVIPAQSIDNVETFVLAVGGPKRYSDVRGVRMASLIGADGGYIYTDRATAIAGSYGGWTLPVTYFNGSGVPLTAKDLVASTYFLETGAGLGNGSGGPTGPVPPAVDERYLHRITWAGDPNLNAMKTDISMQAQGHGAYDIVNISTLNMVAPNNRRSGSYNDGDINNVRNLEINEGSLSLKRTINGQPIVGKFEINPSGNILLDKAFETLNVKGTSSLSNGALSISRGFAEGREVASIGGGLGGISVNKEIWFFKRARGLNDDGDWVDVDLVGNDGWSDMRLKENIRPIDNALEKLLKIRGVYFDWKDTSKAWNKDQKKDSGVIAQEVESVFPELVASENDKMKRVNYPQLTGAVIEAIRELDHTVKDLKHENLVLKQELDALRKKVENKEVTTH